MIQLGDFVGQKHPNENIFLKKGIVVDSLENSYAVQWLLYDKNFWMDFEDAAFEELNRRYLLTKMSYHRDQKSADIVILSKAGKNGLGNP
jgi:hypothetical protein|tara:strand:- start:160 stop:429 length:270 start_codon:yes stop_codon:yes gene_type:complete